MISGNKIGIRQALSKPPFAPPKPQNLGGFFLFCLAFSFQFLILACKIHFICISCPKNLCNPNYLSNFAAQNCLKGIIMKLKIFAFVALISLITVGNVFALDTRAVQDGVVYWLYPSPERAVVYSLEHKVSTEEVEIPAEINHKGTILPVTEVYYGAFKDCENLKTVILPASIKVINERAFEKCSSLEEIVIPDGVEKICKNVFDDCKNLRKITLGAKVKDIDFLSLGGCVSLVSITVNENNENFCSEKGVLFSKDKSILYIYPKGKTAREYVVPEGVKTIKDRAFKDCKNLTAVALPESLETIEDAAFNHCNRLTSLSIPKNVNSLAYTAFHGCDGVKSVVWNAKRCKSPKGYIARVPFEMDVTSFIFGNEVEVIPSMLCANMKIATVTLPNSLKEIGTRAFSECANLTAIKIPNGVEKIGEGAFSLCRKVTSFRIPNSVKTIGDRAFSMCDVLKSVVIGSGVTSIGKSAFDSNDMLRTITCLATTPPDFKLHESVYDYVSVVLVPSGSVNDYKDAEGWNGFKKISANTAQ